VRILEKNLNTENCELNTGKILATTIFVSTIGKN
jgi:hypothetical protein